MRQFIKRILYCFILFFTFLLLMYIIAFCVGKPELNKDRYIKLYDDQNKIFIKVSIIIVGNMFQLMMLVLIF